MTFWREGDRLWAELTGMGRSELLPESENIYTLKATQGKVVFGRAADGTLPDLVKTVPHLAFEVEDLEGVLAGHEVIITPIIPSPGVRAAFLVHQGAPVELPEFTDPDHLDRKPWCRDTYDRR